MFVGDGGRDLARQLIGLEVDCAPVGQTRRNQVSESAEDAIGIERSREAVAFLDEQRQVLLGGGSGGIGCPLGDAKAVPLKFCGAPIGDVIHNAIPGDGLLVLDLYPALTLNPSYDPRRLDDPVFRGVMTSVARQTGNKSRHVFEVIGVNKGGVFLERACEIGVRHPIDPAGGFVPIHLAGGRIPAPRADAGRGEQCREIMWYIS